MDAFSSPLSVSLTGLLPLGLLQDAAVVSAEKQREAEAGKAVLEAEEEQRHRQGTEKH